MLHKSRLFLLYDCIQHFDLHMISMSSELESCKHNEGKHNITMHLHDGLFPKKEAKIKKRIIIYNLLRSSWYTTFYLWIIVDSCVHLKHGPPKHIQGVV